MNAQPRDSIDELVQRAEQAFERGEIEEAYRLLTEAAAQNDSHPQVLNDLGAILAGGGCLEQAESYFRKALEVDPALQDAYVNLGRILLATGRVDEARRILDSYRSRGFKGDADADELEQLLVAAARTLEGRPVAVESLGRAAEVWPERVALYEVMASYLRPGARVCDLSGFSGFGARLLHERGAQVVTLIADEGLASFARTVHQAAGVKIESVDPLGGLRCLEAESLDAIVAVGALEGTTAPGELAREIERTLKTGGLVLVAEKATRLPATAPSPSPRTAPLEEALAQRGLPCFERRSQTSSGDLVRDAPPPSGGWVLTVWQRPGSLALTDWPRYVSRPSDEQPLALLADWRRTAGEAHLHVRRALAGLGYRLVDAGLSELEELTAKVPLEAAEGEVDIERIVEAALLQGYGSACAADAALRTQVRAQFERLLALFRRAAAALHPQLIVTSAGGWLESRAALAAAREFGIGIVTVDATAYGDRCAIDVIDARTGARVPGVRQRFEELRWHRGSDLDAWLVSSAHHQEDTDETRRRQILAQLRVPPQALLGVLIADPERTWAGRAPLAPFTSIWDLIGETVRVVSDRTRCHLVIWVPENDLDGSGGDPLEALKTRGLLRSNVSAVVAREDEISPLIDASAFVVTTGSPLALSWLARGLPVVAVGEISWSGLGFTRDVTRQALLRPVLEEVLARPSLSLEEKRLADRFLSDYREEVLVPISYEAIRDALANRLDGLGRLAIPLAAAVTRPDWQAQKPASDRLHAPPQVEITPRASSRSPVPEISLIIPTAGRPAIVRNLLERLGRQTIPPHRYEVIVTDDGTDPPLRQRLSDLCVPYRLQLLRTEKQGPSLARNRAIGAAAAPYLLILNDDAVPGVDLVERHLEAQKSSPEPRAYLGEFVFDDESMTPLARALSETELLFPYRQVNRAGPNPGRFFWTCNVSVPRQAVLDAGGFDEAFPYQSEDVELGYRLEKRGVGVYFLPSACAGHHHHVDAAWFERRQVSLGYQMVLLYHKHRDPALLPTGRALNEAEVHALECEVRCRGGRRHDLVAKIEETESRARGEMPEASLVRELLPLVRRLSDDSIATGLLAGFKGLDIDGMTRLLEGLPQRTTLVVAMAGPASEAVSALQQIRHLAGAPLEIIALVETGALAGGDPLAVLADCRALEIESGETLLDLRSRLLEMASGAQLAFASWGCRYPENWLSRLVDVLARDESVGAVGPELVETGEGDALGGSRDVGPLAVEEVSRLHPALVVARRRAVSETLAPVGVSDFQERLRMKGYRLLRVNDVKVALPTATVLASA
ncbi:MAG: glycosyltransferase [Planctomycetota bacterium]